MLAHVFERLVRYGACELPRISSYELFSKITSCTYFVVYVAEFRAPAAVGVAGTEALALPQPARVPTARSRTGQDMRLKFSSSKNTRLSSCDAIAHLFKKP